MSMVMASLFHPLFRSWADRCLAHPIKGTIEIPDEANNDADRGNENIDPNVNTRKQTLQNVSTKAQCVKVLKWMEVVVLARGHEHCLVLETIRHFTDIFRSPSHNANLLKCAQWWKL